MKKVLAIVLAVVLVLAQLTLAVFADDNELVITEEYGDGGDAAENAVYGSDEIGDYVEYESGWKMYIRFNPETDVRIDENGFIYVCGADGNRLDISFEIDASDPRISALQEEYESSKQSVNTVDEDVETVDPTEGSESDGSENPHTGLGLAVMPMAAALAAAAFGRKKI